MKTIKKPLNKLTFSILVGYPILLLCALFWYLANYNLQTSDIAFFITSYYLCNISVGLGFHRLWSHQAYKTNKVVEFFLVMLTAGTLQGPVLAWASDHHKHHSFTDKEGDPHSPLKYKNKWLGFIWSHIGWMVTDEATIKHIDAITMAKLGKNRLLMWQLKYYVHLAIFMNLVLPLALGFLVHGTLIGMVATFIFVGLGRALQQQVTFCVNSLCHIVGTKKYSVTTAHDIWWLALLLLGENWHDFHHAFARDYRNGHKWYHFDVHKWLIFLMSKVGLAWDLVVTSEERIAAKCIEFDKQIQLNTKQRLTFLKSWAEEVSLSAHEKIASLKESQKNAYAHLARKLLTLEATALEIKAKADRYIEEIDLLEEPMLLEIYKKAQQIRASANKLGIYIKSDLPGALA